MDIIYDDEMPECENCGNEVMEDDIPIALAEWKYILCSPCMEELE